MSDTLKKGKGNTKIATPHKSEGDATSNCHRGKDKNANDTLAEERKNASNNATLDSRDGDTLMREETKVKRNDVPRKGKNDTAPPPVKETNTQRKEGNQQQQQKKQVYTRKTDDRDAKNERSDTTHQPSGDNHQATSTLNEEVKVDRHEVRGRSQKRGAYGGLDPARKRNT